MGIGAIVAGIVAYIAWQQYRIERNKLRLAFYDRRLKVYNAIKELFLKVQVHGSIRANMWSNYMNGTSEASFLFSSEISDLKELVDKKALLLFSVQADLKVLPKGDELNAKVKEQSELLRWFAGESGGIKDKFETYLKFEKIEQSNRPWLAIVLVVLVVFAIWTNSNKTEPYAICGSPTQGTTYVLDTKTGQLWLRTVTGNIYLGTNENPESKGIPVESNKPKQEKPSEN